MPLVNLQLEPTIDWAGGMRSTWGPGEDGAQYELQRFLDTAVTGYSEHRDRPDEVQTSRLSPYLHFGEISPRQVWHAVRKHAGKHPAIQRGAEAYLRQLGWREFAHHLLFHFPHTVDQSLRAEFADFPWRDNSVDLKAWQRGRTGYPLVDAGMRELWATGWMHNRVRMVAASFLVKHLLLPWQAGDRWFWDTLVDADLANNTLGWQWVAGCGADAAPYFRIFNPVSQGEKFDPNGNYVRRWVPELSRLPAEWIHKPWEAPTNVLAEAGVKLGMTYPEPIVDHHTARIRALAALAKLKKENVMNSRDIVEQRPRILLTGATGYVGGRLLKALEVGGHRVRCLARRPEFLRARVAGTTEVIQGDVLDPPSLANALDGVHTAYYLVHSMGSTGAFEDEDRQAARNFATATRAAGVQRLIYLGGLGDREEALSPHLRSRHEVGDILRESGIQVVEFRASIVIGSGSLSFEMIRTLVERLPVMVTPRWVSTLAQAHRHQGFGGLILWRRLITLLAAILFSRLAARTASRMET